MRPKGNALMRQVLGAYLKDGRFGISCDLEVFDTPSQAGVILGKIGRMVLGKFEKEGMIDQSEMVNAFHKEFELMQVEEEPEQEVDSVVRFDGNNGDGK